ncbi:MAG: DUF2235 domain-containing protein [Bryobacteraceae bacterium]
MSGQVQLTSDGKSYEQLYDSVGNVVQHLTHFGDGLDYVVRYDYDERNQKIHDWYRTQVGTVGEGIATSYGYDGNGRVADVRDYFGADAKGTWTQNGDGTFTFSMAGFLRHAEETTYDADGRVTQVVDYGRDGTVDWQQSVGRALDGGGGTEDAQRTDLSVLTALSKVAYTQLDGSSGYDAAGNLTDYYYQILGTESGIYANGDPGTRQAYHTGYLKRDGYLTQTVSGSSPDDSNFRPTTSTTAYDAFGRTLSVTEHTTYSSPIDDRVRYFGNDAAGEILSRRDGTIDHTSGAFTQTDAGAQTSHNYFVDGQQVAVLKENGEINVANLLTGFEAGGTDGYVVQSGDTLAGIAQKVYGNESLWYVIADANALESDSDLVVGAQIKLPQVAVNSNDAQTFKPYNPAESIGSQTPALPYIAPPPSQHCNTLAMIVVIAVTIVVTAFTMGATSGLLAAEFGAAFAGSAVGFGIAAAVGGFVGNVAGQLTADATGVQNGFSFSQALNAGLVNGITMGVGKGLTEAGSTTSWIADVNGKLRPAGYALQGAAGYAGNVAAGKLTGQPTHFAWANLVADAVGSAVTGKLDLPTDTQLRAGFGTGNFLEDLKGGLVNGAINAETGRLLGGQAANGRQIFEDAFGNALGNAIVGEINHVEQRNEAIKQLSPEAKAWYDGKVSQGADEDATLTRAQFYDTSEGFKNTGLQGPASIFDPTGMSLSTGDSQIPPGRLGNVQSLGLSPLADPNDPHTYYITTVFDGTSDNYTQMLDPSNPGVFYRDLLETGGGTNAFTIYENGVGTGDEGSFSGDVFGLGAKERESKAMLLLSRQMQEIYGRDSQANIIVNTIGFSRGAAESIDFGNLIEQGVPIPGESDANGQPLTYSGEQAPRIGAMVLYDPVASFGIAGNDINLGYNLNIPASAEHVLEITARDESRLFFPLTSAVDPSQETDGFYNHGRIVQLTLPGVHSDIGGGYPNPYSYYSLDMGYSFLQQLGVPLNPLTSQGYDYNVNDYSLDNLRVHDSSWGVDKILHDFGIHTSRTIYPHRSPNPQLLYPDIGH